MASDADTFGDLLRAQRLAAGLTQEALAKVAGVPRSTIANLESGQGNPSLAVLVKVANALGVPIDELLASPRAKVRKWAAVDVPTQTQGRGVTLRPLVTEPVPEEMLTDGVRATRRDARDAAFARDA